MERVAACVLEQRAHPPRRQPAGPQSLPQRDELGAREAGQAQASGSVVAGEKATPTLPKPRQVSRARGEERQHSLLVQPPDSRQDRDGGSSVRRRQVIDRDDDHRSHALGATDQPYERISHVEWFGIVRDLAPLPPRSGGQRVRRRRHELAHQAKRAQ